MSVSRRFFTRLFLGGAILCLVIGLTALLVGDARWMPAGVRVTLAQMTAAFRSSPSCPSSGTFRPGKPAEEPVRLEEIADQFEPDPDQLTEVSTSREQLPDYGRDDRSDEPLNDRIAQKDREDEAIDPESDPVVSPATRQRMAQRRPVRLMPPEPVDDPFDSAGGSRASRDGVKTAVFEETAEEAAPARKPTRPQRVDETQEGAAPPAVAAKSKGGVSPPPVGDTPAPTAATLLPMPEIEQLIAAGNFVSAQRELSKWYWRTPSMRSQLRKKLDELAQSLYFSPQPTFHEPYLIQPGDQLRVVAGRYKISWEYLAKLNRVDAKKVRAGQKLKVVEGPFSALVTLASHELIVHLNGSFVKSYRVGVGKEGTSPVGTFIVKNKVLDPTYYGPDGIVIANDDPQNPLGEHWIDIGDSFGIHGTIDPDSIGRNESRGCIRMLNSDVEEVYDLLVIGSQVKIQR